MRVLFITDNFPHPPIDGGQVNIYYLLMNLSKQDGFVVDLLFVGNKYKLNNESVDIIGELVNKLFIRHLSNSKLIRFSKLLFEKNFGLDINYDLLFFSTFLSSFTWFNFGSNIKTILYQADSRTLYYSHRSGFFNKVKYFKYKFEQKLMFKNFDRIIFVSELDEVESNNYTNLWNRTQVIPIGINLPKKQEQNLNSEIDLVFTGNFCFPPNSEGAIKFLNDIFPSLLKSRPNITIYFVGRFPSNELIAFESKYPQNIFVTGEVKSISEYLLKAKIFFSPLYWGSGMKNKILEAMLHKLPIVCTNESTAGIKYKELFFIANDINDWILKINYLLDNPEARHKSGEENYITVQNNYTYDIITYKHFIPMFENLASDNCSK